MTAKLKERVAKRIRELRGDMTQAEFASKIGAYQGQVSDWEKGKHIPSYAVLDRICELTGADLNEFKGGKK